MKSFTTFTKLSLALGLAGVALFATTSQAQTFRYSYGYTGGGHGHCAPDFLGQYVLHLDQYGHQMSYIYGIESRNYCGCRNAATLLAEMRRYNCCTQSLVTAYHGNCACTFKKAACAVRDSLCRIENLSRCTRVSHQVNCLIRQSLPLATYVHNNAGNFRPTRIHGTPHVVPHGGVTYHRRHNDGIDVGSAIFGAVAGRVLHQIIHH